MSSWAEAPGMLGLDQGVASPHTWVPVLTVGTGVSAGGDLEAMDKVRVTGGQEARVKVRTGSTPGDISQMKLG